MFLKRSDSPLVYDTTTYPTLGLGNVVVVSSLLVLLLLWSCEALFPIVFSGCLLWSCKVLFTMVFWSTTVLVLLLPAWMLLLSLFPSYCCLKFTLYPINGPVGVFAFDQGFPKV